MARITVEDCLDKVENRFELVMVSSKRARQLQIEGKDPLVSVDNDKPTVIALREIAENHITAAILTEKPKSEVDTVNLEQEMEDAVSAVADQAAEKAAEKAATPEVAVTPEKAPSTEG